jgi:hypothetical protein
MNSYEVGLIFKLSKHFEFGPLYKFEHEKSLSGQTTDENRIPLEGTLKWLHGDSKFSNRHRVNYRNIDGKESWAGSGNMTRLIRTLSIRPTVLTLVDLFAREILIDCSGGDSALAHCENYRCKK